MIDLKSSDHLNVQTAGIFVWLLSFVHPTRDVLKLKKPVPEADMQTNVKVLFVVYFSIVFP